MRQAIMTILVQSFAFLRQILGAVKTRTAAHGNCPSNPTPNAQGRTRTVLPRSLRPECFDPPDDFVSQYSWSRLGATPSMSVQVTAAKCATRDPHQQFRAAEFRDLQANLLETVAGEYDRAIHLRAHRSISIEVNAPP